MKFTKQTKQVVILYASTLSGVLLGVVASIINTRFLSPADYGDVRYVQNAAIRVFPVRQPIAGHLIGGIRKQAHTRMYDRHSGRSTRCTDSRHFNLHRIAIRTRKRPHRSSVSPIGPRLRLPSFPELCKHDRHGRQPHQTARRSTVAAQFKLYSDRILAIQPIGRHLLPHDSIAMGTGVVDSVPHNLIDPPPVQATIPHIPHFEQGE